MKMYDAFAEDSWKLTPNLTVNLGVRYDIQLTPAPGLINNNYPTDLHRVQSAPSRTSLTAFSRVSALAGRPTPALYVRGGYGLFSALNQGSTYYAMRVENGVVQVNYNYTGCESSVGSVSKCPLPDRSQQRQQLAVSLRPIPRHRPTAIRRSHSRRRYGPGRQRPTDRWLAELPRPRPELRSAVGARV